MTIGQMATGDTASDPFSRSAQHGVPAEGAVAPGQQVPAPFLQAPRVMWCHRSVITRRPRAHRRPGLDPGHSED